MADSERRARGAAKFQEVMGFPPPPVAGSPFFEQTLEHLFADVWSRPGLPVRERRLVTLTVLMQLGHEPTLKLHMGAALRSGDLSEGELEELVVHVAHYAGWPPGALGFQVLGQLRAERAKEGERA
jgi:4-carboxymuconolactone decarboxylase